ncbi:MAG: hypothetical protein A2293_05950 [Elusimicrobia bacterium RIFOXYB2_FULL_49_7]|nr:MAG: hypothetical protein A2293_05950 [Elusimicrobia bacterium RIFOXYB2_FULL_49_7]
MTLNVYGAWIQTNCPTGNNILALAANGSNLYAGLYSAGVYLSSDNGSTWTEISDGLPDNTTVYALLPYNANLYAGTYGKGVYLSKDNGTTWLSANNGLPSNATVTVLSVMASHLIAGTYAKGIYTSADEGGTWTASSTGLPVNQTINAITISGTTVFIGVESGIYRSSDDGATWSAACTGLPGNVIVNGLTALGSTIYAGTNGGGVYYSNDDGNNWTALNSGLSSSASILSMSAMTADVFIGLVGAVYHNNGTSWSAVNSGLSSSYSVLSMTATGGYLFIGTNSGVWRSPLPPVAPSYFIPADKSTNQDDSLTLSWSSVTSATSYSVQVSTDSTFSSSIAFSKTGLTLSSQVVTGLTNNTVYFWRVNASNNGGTSAWSVKNQFITTLLSPTPASPTDGAIHQATTLNLSWNAVATADSYGLQVSTDSSFSNSIVYSQLGLTNTSQTVNGLANNKTYYWRINASNSGGTSHWSRHSRFTTIVAVPDSPILSSPSDRTNDLGCSLSLSWNSVATAVSYSLQVSTDSLFSSGVVSNQSGLTATTYALSGLTHYTTYYWRVSASNIAGTGKWSSVYSFSTVLAAPTLSFPSTGATGLAIAPTLSWNTVSFATVYSLQISNDSTFSASIVYSRTGLTAPSHTLSMNLSNNTTYYWRVNAGNATSVSAWSTKNTFTTIIALPQAPILISPYNQATNQSVSPSLSWNVVSTATAYTLQVSTDSTFAGSMICNQSGLTATSQTVSGLSYTTLYYWRVSATNSAGTGSWSVVNGFTTILKAPSLVAPGNGALGQAVSLDLQWNAVATASSYALQVSTDSTFSVSLFFNQSGLTDTAQRISGLSNNTIYYWRVKAINPGGASDWSARYRLTTLLAAPVPISPLDKSTNQAVSLTLKWNTVTSATSYGLQVSTDSTFSTSMTYNQNGLTTSSQTISALANSTSYFWRVNATNAGGTSVWSDIFHFSTVLAAPSLVSPATGATAQPTTLTFSWNTVSAASSYTLQVSTVSTLTTYVYNQSGIASTSQAVEGLSNNTVYYWRVSASNTGGASAWSTAYKLTTLIAPPAAPVLASPLNSAIGQAVSLSLKWYASTSATSYGLQVSTDSTFATGFVCNFSGLTLLYQALSGLSNNTVYYWRVNATNAGGISHWSDFNRFTTVTLVPPAVPTLSIPANNTVNQSLSPMLSWMTSSSATSYSLQVSVDSIFSGTYVYNQNGLTSIAQTITGLLNNRVYFWRVNASNANGTSSWSTPYRFMTMIGSPELNRPLNGVLGQPLALELEWGAVSAATSYHLQVSTDSTFAKTIFYSQAGLTGLSQTLSGIANNTKYYWRVSATNPNGTGNWSSVHNFTTVIGSPIPALPVNSSVNQAVSLKLSWNTVPTATSYGVQISQDSTFTGPMTYGQVGLTTAYLTLSGLSANTTYYWRVNAANAGGTGEWSVAFHFTTLPAAPVPVSPVNNALNQPLLLTLKWNPAESATAYSLQVATDTVFLTSVMVNLSGLTVLEQNISGLANNKTYYWRVCATNLNGTGNWSSKYAFTTRISAPTPVSPSNNATNQTTSLKLSWNTVATATSYGIQVSSDSTFAVSVVYGQTGLSVANQTVTGLLYSTTYYWRVNATNAGGTSEWSAANSFRTATAAPVVISPINSVTQSVTFQWDTVQNATSYCLQVSTDSAFQSGVVFNQSGLSYTAYTITTLSAGMVYYWRVNATNATGTSIWSAMSRFTTISAPPTLLSPVDNATEIPVILTLKWSAEATALSYSVQVSTDSTFVTSSMNTLSANFIALSGLKNNTRYFWRVKTTNAGGTSYWSAVNRFTTIVTTPVAPTLSETAGGSLTITLSWDPVENATTYTLQISKDSLFSSVSIVYDENGIDTTFQTVSGLTGNVIYYWRVNATNAAGTSPWSSANFFEVQSTSAEAALLREIPESFMLGNAQPNPFNPTTRIMFAVPAKNKNGAGSRSASMQSIKINVYDIRGRWVITLVDGRFAAGYHYTQFNGQNSIGQLLGAGTYIYRMEAMGYVNARRLVLMK